MPLDHDDPINDLFSAPGTAPVVRPLPAGYVPWETRVSPEYAEPCTKCRGSGRFCSYSGRDFGPCFACKGSGKKTFKSAPEVRAAKKVAYVQNKAARAEDNWAHFAGEFPAEASWILSKPKFEFAASLCEGVRKYGGLTERQMATVRRLMVKDAERAALRESRANNAPTIESSGVATIERAFSKARENGIAVPHLRLGAYNFKPAPPTGKWPGSIYVKDSAREYMGRITEGKFHGSFACTADAEKDIVAFASNPDEAALAYGRRTGHCSCCGRELTVRESIERGIGPICYAKYFGG